MEQRYKQEGMQMGFEGGLQCAGDGFIQSQMEVSALIGTMAAIRDMMATMADTIRTTNERMSALEQQVRQLTKLTPAQVKAINEAIRVRAVECCASYGVQGRERAVANAIRREAKLVLGASAVREICRGDYTIAMRMIGMWDDYDQMQRIGGLHEHN